MNSTQTMKAFANQQQRINELNERHPQQLTSPRSIYFDNVRLKKHFDEYNSSPSDNSKFKNSSPINLSYQQSPKLQISIQKSSMQQAQNDRYIYTPDSPNQPYTRSDFCTYAKHKYLQLKQQQKSQSATNSLINHHSSHFKKEITTSSFAPNHSTQQKQLERFIKKSQKSLTHFTARNKEALNERNIQIPHILSEPQKIDYLFNDLHLGNAENLRQSQNNQPQYQQPQQSSSSSTLNSQTQNNFLRNRIQQNSSSSNRNSNLFATNYSSLPSFTDNLFKSSTLLKIEKNEESPLSPIKRIFGSKTPGQQLSRKLKLSDSLFSAIDSPIQIPSPSKNANLKIKIVPQSHKINSSSLPVTQINSEIRQQSNSESKVLNNYESKVLNNYESQVLNNGEINFLYPNQCNDNDAGEQKKTNRKKISWSDQMYIEVKKQQGQQNKVFCGEYEEVSNFNINFNSNNDSKNKFIPQKTFETFHQSHVLPRKSLSMQFSEMNSPIKPTERMSQSKTNEQKILFLEEIKKQMGMLEQNPKETAIERNFKKFRIIEDLQKLRIEEKINQFKIVDKVDQKQILKRNASRVLMATQTTISSSQGTLNHIPASFSRQNTPNMLLSSNPNQNCPKISIVEENEISREELNRSDYSQKQNAIIQAVQAPPSLQNIESAITINEIEPIIPSSDSVERLNFTGLLRKSLNINLQGLNKQEIDDEIETPNISQSNGDCCNQPQSSTRQKHTSVEQRHTLINSPDMLAKVSPSPSTQTSQMEVVNLNSFSQLEPKMILRKQQTLTMKLKPIYSQDIGDSQISEIENLVKNHTNDNSFSTNSPRSPYTRKQQKQSTRKSAFTQINPDQNTPKNSGRRGTIRTLTFNQKIPSHEQITLLDGFWNEEEIKILHELSFFITDLIKALQFDPSSQLNKDISYFCTQDLDQFNFSISQYIQYICTDKQQNRNDHYICPFKLNPTLIEQILQVFLDKLSSLNQDVRAIDIFRNAFNKHKQLILATTIQERLGGELQKQRIIGDVIDYQISCSTNQIFEQYQKEDLIKSQLKTMNLIVKSSEEEVSEPEWSEVKYYNAVDVFESKKAFLTVMRKYKNFYNEDFCYEFIQQIEKCRDNITHSLSIHRYEKVEKFMKSLREYLAKIQFIQKLGQSERDVIINNFLYYVFSTTVTSQQLTSIFQQHISSLNASHLKEIKDIIHNHLKLETEYKENPEYSLQFEYKFEKLNWIINGNTLLQLGDLNLFFEQFNHWVDRQIVQKHNLGGFEAYEVKSTENFEAIIKLYYSPFEVFHIKDVQFSLSLPIFEPETLLKFWMKGIKHTIMSHCGLEKEEAKSLRDSISNVIIKSGVLKNIRRQNTSSSIKNSSFNLI